MLYKIAVLTSVFQIYTFSLMGIYPSLSFLFSLTLWTSFIRNLKNILGFKPIRTYVFLIIVQMLSIVWSSDIYLGIRTVSYLLPFLFIFLTTYEISKNNSELYFIKILVVYSFFLVVEAVLVILFRLQPNLETLFLNSNISQIFIKPNVITQFGTVIRNNVLDPTKSGGFFLNANVAAAFLGINMYVLYGIYKAYSSKVLKNISIFLWIAILFTGSKIGIILDILFPLTAFLIVNFKVFNKVTYSNLVKLLFLILILAIGIFGIVSYAEGKFFIYDAEHTFNVRLMIWKHAWFQFQLHPILGQGFGGWEATYPQYAQTVGLSPSYPPHNTLIYLWSQSGILAFVLGVLFIIDIILFFWNGLRNDDKQVKILSLYFMFAFLWLFIQGFGENYGIIGEEHMQPILAVALGLLYTKTHFYENGGRKNEA